MAPRQVPGVLEIRIHGVSGTPPQHMLGVPATEVGQVAGDRVTGLYRSRKTHGAYGISTPSYVAVEAYSWGALTSGAAGFLGWVRRAAWLTLLPFALGNLAYWARPELDVDSRIRRATAVVVRIAGLLLTMLLVASVCLIGIDLIGWQCFRGGSMVCPSLPWWLQFLDRPPWDGPGRRVLVGSLLPFGVLLVLWVLARRSLERYEEVELQDEPPQRTGILSRPKMWAGSDRTGRLMRLHIAAGAAIVVVSGALPLGTLSGTAAQQVLAMGGLAAAVLAVLALVAAALGYADGIDFPGASDSSTSRGRGLAAVVWSSVWVLVIVHVLLLWVLGPAGEAQTGPLRGHNLIVGALLFLLVAATGWLVFATDGPWWALLVPGGLLVVAAGAYVGYWWLVGGVALIVIGLGAWLQHRRPDPDPRKPRAWHGAGPAVLLGAAVWIAAVFSTATVVAAADWLNGGGQSVADLQSEFREDASPGLRAAQLQARALPAVTASGSVVLTGARVRVDVDGSVFVYSGTLTADSMSATRALDGIRHAVPGVDLGIGRVAVLDPPVTLVDSCVRGASGPVGVPDCSPASGTNPAGYQSDEYVATGTVDPQGSLLITAEPAAPVHLVVGDVPQEPLLVPQVLVWFALVIPLWLVVVAVAAAWCLRRFRKRAGEDIDKQAEKDRVPDGLHRRSGSARRMAGFTHRAERLVGIIGVITAVAAVAVLIGASTGAPPWQDRREMRWLADLGLWAALGASAGLIAVAASMRKSESARRSVGVLWDLSTFWPRVAHPLGPPCYAERVVPEVVARAKWALSSGATVILSGHSQGSLIAVAVLSRLSTDQLERVRVVTYGSQLRTWYGRVFPGVLGPAVIGNDPLANCADFSTAVPDAPDDVGAGVALSGPSTVRLGDEATLGHRLGIRSQNPRWINLFRRTDPIGFRVFSDRQSLVDRYVSEYSPGAPGDPSPLLATHSNYQFSAEYRAVVEKWYAEPGYLEGDEADVRRVGTLVLG